MSLHKCCQIPRDPNHPIRALNLYNSEIFNIQQFCYNQFVQSSNHKHVLSFKCQLSMKELIDFQNTLLTEMFSTTTTCSHTKLMLSGATNICQPTINDKVINPNIDIHYWLYFKLPP